MVARRERYSGRAALLAIPLMSDTLRAVHDMRKRPVQAVPWRGVQDVQAVVKAGTELGRCLRTMLG